VQDTGIGDIGDTSVVSAHAPPPRTHRALFFYRRPYLLDHVQIVALTDMKKELCESRVEIETLKIMLADSEKQCTDAHELAAQLSDTRTKELQELKIALAHETTKAVEMSRLYQLMEAKKDEAFLNGLERGFAQGKSMLAK